MRIGFFFILLPLVSAAGGAQQVPATWRVENGRRIGSVDDPLEALTEIGQVLVGPNRQLYLAQPMDRTIRIHDADGHFLKSIGRQGQGPGEFESILSIGFIGDTLYASDTRLGRVSFFDVDGRYLTSSRLVSLGFERGPVRYIPTVAQVLAQDGSALVKPFSAVAMTRPAANAETWQVYLHVDRAGEVLDTVAWEPTRPDPRHPPVIMSQNGNQTFALDPFGDRPIYRLAVDGSGLVIVDRAAAAKPGESIFRVRKLECVRQGALFANVLVPCRTGTADRGGLGREGHSLPIVNAYGAGRSASHTAEPGRSRARSPIGRAHPANGVTRFRGGNGTGRVHLAQSGDAPGWDGALGCPERKRRTPRYAATTCGGKGRGCIGGRAGDGTEWTLLTFRMSRSIGSTASSHRNVNGELLPDLPGVHARKFNNRDHWLGSRCTQ